MFVQRFELNQLGQDYVVGDIHGEYHLLQQELNNIGFNQSIDRLFCVGDLVDRGKYSSHAIKWLNKPWFHSCRGNHDDFLLHAYADNNFDLNLWTSTNGGKWWKTIDEKTQYELYEAFLSMPIAIEIESKKGIIGIVHADVPAQLSWQAFTKALEQDNQSAFEHALWSRKRAYGKVTNPVAGAFRVFCGHTVMHDGCYIVRGNVFFIDTGSGYQSSDSILTLLPIDI
ncbi:MAG: metallophosphoesterase [Methylococcales bacterium]|jgi:serine/threonine protein phosphatase 1|nr:metallophosphoesterase [Methylococcales bacterium]MBT7410592.1 metallophosphoesterase [Methylococcales bacterium]